MSKYIKMYHHIPLTKSLDIYEDYIDDKVLIIRIYITN